LEFRRAIELNPGYATASLVRLAFESVGALRPSDRRNEKAKNSDPLSLIISSDLAELLVLAHSDDESIAEIEKAVQLSSGSPTRIANLARAYVASGRKSEAIKLLNDLKQGSNRTDSHA
jgi:Flp pilus assembly protein TadD